MSELKPLGCPFCGSSVRALSRFHPRDPNSRYVSCAAKTCDMQPETPTYQTEAEAIAAWNRRPATEALVERDAIYTPDQQRAADYLAEITGIGGGPDPVGSLIAIHNAQRLKREALVEALTDFTDYYPMGINPYLDEACRKARAARQRP